MFTYIYLVLGLFLLMQRPYLTSLSLEPKSRNPVEEHSESLRPHSHQPRRKFALHPLASDPHWEGSCESPCICRPSSKHSLSRNIVFYIPCDIIDQWFLHFLVPSKWFQQDVRIRFAVCSYASGTIFIRTAAISSSSTIPSPFKSNLCSAFASQALNTSQYLQVVCVTWSKKNRKILHQYSDKLLRKGFGNHHLGQLRPAQAEQMSLHCNSHIHEEMKPQKDKKKILLYVVKDWHQA